MVLEVNDLVKRYGDLVALDHLNLRVEEGEVFGLLGPNGSGKSTAISCILSLLKYSKGDVRIFGKPMKPDAYDIKRDIGVIFQNVAVFNELSVYENISYFCGLYVPEKEKRRQLVEEAIAFVGLEDFRKFRPKKLSGGLLRRLNIACGVAHKPRLIILDEPTVAVDPQSRNKILEGIQQLNREGASIIYTSHYMEEVEQICTRIGIMDRGRIVAEGTTDSLRGLIKTGEKIIAELPGSPTLALEELRALPRVTKADYENGTLTVVSAQGKSNLPVVLDFLKTRSVEYGRIYCELPTLNDVFLEITGKQLRD